MRGEVDEGRGSGWIYVCALVKWIVYKNYVIHDKHRIFCQWRSDSANCRKMDPYCRKGRKDLAEG
jgi:hypothetical protein